MKNKEEKQYPERCSKCGCFINKSQNNHNCNLIRNKISLAHKGKKHTQETKKLIGLINKGRKKTLEDKEGCRQRIKQYIKDSRMGQQKGINHWNWKGGISPLNHKLRTSSLWKIWREAIFIRDNFTCQNLNCEYCHNKIGVMLHPHHIKSFSQSPQLRFNINNGITYCKEFHINSKELHKGIIHSTKLKGGNN